MRDIGRSLQWVSVDYFYPKSAGIFTQMIAGILAR
jgi:hypothetical protein